MIHLIIFLQFTAVSHPHEAATPTVISEQIATIDKLHDTLQNLSKQMQRWNKRHLLQFNVSMSKKLSTKFPDCQKLNANHETIAVTTKKN